MKICLASVQHSAAHHAGMQVRQQANEPDNPKIKIRERHPDGISLQLMDYRQRQPKNIVARLTIWHQLINHFRHVAQGHQSWICDLRR
jgi:hypothetical protein